MPRETLDVPLYPAPMGTRRTVRMIRFGHPAAHPKAYIQAGLHADETPGMLVAQHLLQQLDAAEARDEITGQVVVVPCANPIGLAQHINGEQSGRFDLASGANFNRGWTELSGAVADRVSGRLDVDGRENVNVIRQAMRAALEDAAPARELDALRNTLAREACDADVVLDLHCDDDALMHLYLMSSQWPLARDLAGDLDCRAVLLADNAGGATFAESCFLPWPRLASAFPGCPIPQACLSVTVELRGFADVGDDLAAADAAALFRGLQRRGLVAGDPGRAPDCACTPTGMEACDVVRTPIAGIISYRAGLGEQVSVGDSIADIVDPSGSTPGGARRSVRSGANGIVLSRRLRRLVSPGDVIAKIVGTEPLDHRQGHLLED